MIEDFKLRKELGGVLDELMKSYREHSKLSNIGQTVLPSRDAIVEILEDLDELLYPGYFGQQSLTEENLVHFAGSMLDEVYRKLTVQIFLSIRHTCERTAKPERCSHCEKQAEAEAVTFLRKLGKMREMLELDLQAAYDGDPAAKSLGEIIFSYPGLKAITVYRIAHELHEQQIAMMPRIMTELAHTLTGIDIHPGAKIGRSFFIDHGTGIVIGETSEIGNNVKIYQGATLGAKSPAKGQSIRGTKRHPTVEDDVVIYSGATLLGDILIGKGSIVGGNVWLTESVPPGTRVFIEGVGQKIIKREAKKKE